MQFSHFVNFQDCIFKIHFTKVMFTWNNKEFPQRPGILTAEVGIYKKTRKHAFDQKSDQEKKKEKKENTLSTKKAIKKKRQSETVKKKKKKNTLSTKKAAKKRRKNFLLFLVVFLADILGDAEPRGSMSGKLWGSEGRCQL